jgi:PAB1-binding protein PBP1
MYFSKEAIMVEKKGKEERTNCPAGTFFMDLEKTFGRKSPFYEHMTRSKIEFLKGVKSLLDDRIEYLEKKDSKKAGAKMTKVKVE